MTLTRPLEDGLVLDLKFSEGDGTVLHDSSGYRNHGVFGAGAAAPTWASGWMKESKHALVLYEDDETFWSLINSWGIGSYDISGSEETSEVKEGTSSLKMEIIAGSKSTIAASHDWGDGNEQDWSIYNYLVIYLYGMNSGAEFAITLLDPDYANSWDWRVTDNWVGWKRIVLDLENPDNKRGSFALNSVQIISIRLNPSSTGIFYIDRTILDVAQSVLDFDGVNDKVVVTDDASIRFGTGDFTIVVGFKSVTIPVQSYPTMISKGTTGVGDWMLRIVGNDVINFYADTAYWLTTVETYTDDEPHQVVVVRDGDNAYLYVDGVQKDSTTGVNAVDLNTVKEIQIGSAEEVDTRFWDGQIGRVRIWNRALSSEEAALDYAQRRRM